MLERPTRAAHPAEARRPLPRVRQGGICAVVAASSLARLLCLAVLALLALGAAPAAAQFPAEVRGRVTERASGAAVPGARVEAAGASAVAGPDGGFLLRGVVPGTRLVRVTAAGFRAGSFEVEAANGRTVWLAAALDPATVTLAAITATVRPEDGGTTVDRAAIERSGARELGELLRDQAGVTVVRQGGPGAQARISIRGSGAGQVLVLLDGVAINSALTGEADVSTIPLEAVERVTVLRGARSARYGARALGGVVLVETRRPNRPELGARAAAGSWGERRASLSAGGGGSAGATALTGFLAAEGQRAEGDFGFAVPAVRGGGRGVRQNSATASVNVLASGTARRGVGEVSGRVEGFAGDRGMPGSIVQPALTARQEQRRGAAALAARAPWLGVEWRADADAQLQRAAFADPRPPTDTAYDESVDAASGGVALSGRGAAGPLELTGGAEARGLRVTSTMLGEGAPRRQTLGAVWGQAGWHPVAGGWALEVFAAARADWSTLLRGATLSPRVGASAERGRWIGRVSAGRAFAPPTLADQFFHDGVLTRPNPDLRPERVRNEVEAAIELRDAPLGVARVDAEVAAYRADVDGMILWLPDYQFRWSPSNFDVARRGGEVTVRARFPRAELRGTLSHAEVEYRGPVLSGQVALRPRDTGSAAAAATVAGVRAELQGRWVGERFPDAGNTANRIEPHFLADLRLARPFTLRGWRGETTLAVENLADRDAAMLVDYPYPGRTWSVGLRLRRGAPSLTPSERTDR